MATGSLGNWSGYWICTLTQLMLQFFSPWRKRELNIHRVVLLAKNGLQHALELCRNFHLKDGATTENLIIYQSTMKSTNRLVKRNLPPWPQWSKLCILSPLWVSLTAAPVVQIPQADTDSNYEDWRLHEVLTLTFSCIMALSVFAAIFCEISLVNCMQASVLL